MKNDHLRIAMDRLGTRTLSPFPKLLHPLRAELAIPGSNAHAILPHLLDSVDSGVRQEGDL